MSIIKIYWEKFLSFFQSSAAATVGKDNLSFEKSWADLLTGDHVLLNLKSPDEVGIISINHQPQTLTYQRLDEEDIKTKKIVGYVIRKDKIGNYPTTIDFLEINVIKTHKNKKRFVVYWILKEEIESIVHLENTIKQP